jgi:uncharacterized protein YebE (UPF0316 family)
MSGLPINFGDSAFLTWVVVPLLIFAARVLDVSLGTMRIIFLSRGQRLIAPVLGFFEVLIWLIAIRQVMQNLNNPVSYLAYAAGFAAGNLFGMYLENRLAMGLLIIRIITTKEAGALVAQLRTSGYGVTSVQAEGGAGPAQLIFTVIKRKRLDNVRSIIAQCNPKAFVSVEEIRSASEGVFPADLRQKTNPLGFLNLVQKRK